MMNDIFAFMEEDRIYPQMTVLENSILSHKMAFASEDSRKVLKKLIEIKPKKAGHF